MENKYEIRTKRVFDRISSSSDAFLITNIKNIKYLTGFSGSFGIALVTWKGCYLFVDFRYFEQAKKEVKAEVLCFKNLWIDELKKIVNDMQIKRLSFEVTCSYEAFLKLKDNIQIELIPQYYIVEKERAVKDEEEIRNIKEAIKIAESAFLRIKNIIKEGNTEKNIARSLENEIKKESDTLPFPIIVASGENSSMPHWRFSDRTLKRGDFVIIDWGAEYNGYFCDMTRTFIIGEASEKQKEIYELVNNANMQAIKACKADTLAKEIDAAARNLIKQFDYDDKFGHATGHGVGLDIHEFPKINSESEENIKEGMVFTIEPGVYIEGFGGVRIEDMVLVRENSVEILTNLPRDLEIL
ncbi:MAG: aminopeptidase P family protein [Thermodesulfovibrio sp.]|nr:aminopeptidase P family protein [Thermodesulfovibrio sp.]MDW7971913.1 aminopeptidase P family protein [Thermodesulfovibrio sp.]